MRPTRCPDHPDTWVCRDGRCWRCVVTVGPGNFEPRAGFDPRDEIQMFDPRIFFAAIFGVVALKWFAIAQEQRPQLLPDFILKQAAVDAAERLIRKV